MRLNCLCGACNTCSTLGWLIVQCPCGIVSAVFQGRAVVIASLWLVGISALWCGTCISWFSAPINT